MKDENKQEDIIRTDITLGNELPEELGKTIFGDYGAGKDNCTTYLFRRLTDKDTEIIAIIEFEEDGKEY